MQASAEQNAIVEAIKRRECIIIDSVAGSGKTATITFAMKALGEEYVCLALMYNRALCNATEARMKTMEIANLDVQTYHSFASQHYAKCATDEEMRVILDGDLPARQKLKKYDIIFLDEWQDATPYYFRLVSKIFYDIQNDDGISIVVIGDEQQCIYQVNNADSRFLTCGSRLFHVFAPFAHLTLRRSFRLTKPMAEFMNTMVLHEPRIVSEKDGVPVMIVFLNMWSQKQYAGVISYALGKYEAKDIYVLAPSLKGDSSPVHVLENAIVDEGVLCYAPTSDHAKLDIDFTRNKILFSSFHQSKGCERKCCIVIGLSSDYMKYFGGGLDASKCPNPVYVGLTRASEELIIINHCKMGKGKGRVGGFNIDMPSFMTPTFAPCCKFVDSKMNLIHSLGDNRVVADETERRGFKYSVCELTKFVNGANIERVAQIIEPQFVQREGATMNLALPAKVQTGAETFEEVCDINGTAIPLMFADKKSVLPTMISKMSDGRTCVGDYLRLANNYISATSGFNFKVAQIEKYTWLSDEVANACLAVLGTHLVAKTYRCEVPIGNDQKTYIFHVEKKRAEIKGCIDADDGETIWEFKCVERIALEHKIQLACYALLWHIYDQPKRKFKLLNIRTNEVWELMQPCARELMQMVKELLRIKLADKKDVSDDEFVATHLAMVAKYE